MTSEIAAPLAKRLIAGVLVAAALGMVVITVLIPRLTGGAALTVLSGSMTPTYPVGSVVVVRPIEPEDAAVGDAITFVKSGSLTTHRITAIGEDADGELLFTTKGDANRGEDLQPVPAEDVRGRVWFHVPMLGSLRERIASVPGLIVIASLILIAAGWERLTHLVTGRHGMPAESGSTPQTSAPSPTAAQPVTASVERAEPEAAPPGGLPEPLVPVRPFRPDTSGAPSIFQQQLLLGRLSAGAFERGQVLEILGLTGGTVVALSPTEMVVSIAGTADDLDGIERLLRPCGLVEAHRSSTVTVGQGRPIPLAGTAPSVEASSETPDPANADDVGVGSSPTPRQPDGSAIDERSTEQPTSAQAETAELTAADPAGSEATHGTDLIAVAGYHP